MPISTPYSDTDGADELGELLTVSLVQEQVRGWRGSEDWTRLAIAAATEVIEHHIGPVLPRPVVTETLHRTTRSARGYLAVLEHAPVVVGTLARLDGSNATTVIDTDGWQVDHEAGTIRSTGAPLQGARVSYTPGRNPVPAAVKNAALYILQQVADSADGAIPQPTSPYTIGPEGNAPFAVSRGFYLPNRAKDLLRPYWRRG